ncbi:MAG TPA: MOSC domain-containing protein [Chloroflexota bacterium]|nr:MOSC domain-containing protein [Chloroflexota bacterium]
MRQIGILQSMQVGTPHRYGMEGAMEEAGRPWNTSFFREPSPSPRWLYSTHLEGNAQADTKNHGRPGQAVLLYAGAHYPHWREELGMPEIGPGGFGENFTISGLSEETACIGDTYGIGEARVQVSGPRYPCWKIERRWDRPGLTARVAATGRTGWYCRVLSEGLIEPGARIMLIDRPYPKWTVALVNDFGHDRDADLDTARLLAACPLLNDWWRDFVIHRALKLQGRVLEEETA